MLNEFGSGSVIVADSRNPFMWKRLCCDRQTNADIGRSVIVGLRFVIYIHLVPPPLLKESGLTGVCHSECVWMGARKDLRAALLSVSTNLILNCRPQKNLKLN